MDPIKLQYDRMQPRLYWKAAAEACKVKPKRPGLRLLLFVAGWFAIMFVVGLVLQFPVIAQGGPAFLAGMVMMWVGLMVFGRIQRRSMNEILADDQTRRGVVTMELSAEGCVFDSNFGQTMLNWSAVDEIIDLGEGTGLRTGLMVYPLPHHSLPEGLTPEDFRQTLGVWAAKSDAA